MIISDPHFAVNISPFTIYLIDRHGELNPEYVDRLNTDIDLTGTLYRFKLIECTPGRLEGMIPSNLSGYLEQCNILVRLFPTQTHPYSYLTDKLRFEYSYDLLRFKIMEFMSSITYPENDYTENFWKQKGDYKSNYTNFIRLLNFHSSRLEKDIDEFLINKAFSNNIADSFSSMNEEYLRYMGRFDLKGTMDMFNLPDESESTFLFSNIMNGEVKPCSMDVISLKKEKEKDVYIEIVQTERYNVYDYKPKYLFRCHFDLDIVPVYIGRPIPAIIYLYVVLFAKAGKKLNRECLKWYYDRDNYPDYLDCLEDAYNVFFKNQAAKNFKEWLKFDVNKIGEDNDKWHNLDMAKGSISRLIMGQIRKYDDRLSDDKNSIDKITVFTYSKKFQTTYGIKLSPDKIIVPEEFMPIVERIKELDFDGNNGG